MSIDGFSAFQEIGLDNDAAIATEGLKYRDTILSLGGARAPALVFQVTLKTSGASSHMPVAADMQCVRNINPLMYTLLTSILAYRF